MHDRACKRGSGYDRKIPCLNWYPPPEFIAGIPNAGVKSKTQDAGIQRRPEKWYRSRVLPQPSV